MFFTDCAFAFWQAIHAANCNSTRSPDRERHRRAPSGLHRAGVLGRNRGFGFVAVSFGSEDTVATDSIIISYDNPFSSA